MRGGLTFGFRMHLVSQHGNAMPKGLYFTAIVSSFNSSVFLICFFFRRLISAGHWTDLNQTWTHSLMTRFETFGPNSPVHVLTTSWRQKTAFGGTIDRTCLCNGTWYQQSETCQSTARDSPTCPKFGELWPRNGWERLASFCPLPGIRYDTVG